jgi:diguanylate cyclase (GGDEF)-like protein
MIEENTAENEDDRMTFLKGLKILDTPIEERFERITRLVCRSLDTPISAISLIDSERVWFKSIQGIHTPECLRSIAFCKHAIAGEEPLIVTNAIEDSRFYSNPLVSDKPRIRFYAGVPLVMANNVRVGTLCAMDFKPRELTEEQVEVLRDLSEMVETELKSIKLSEAHLGLIKELKQAEKAALIDPLTGLWNRDGGDGLLSREWEAARRLKAPIALAMADLDHFKKINDVYGHEIGDEVLRNFSRTVLSSLRPYDIVCRWGGEEFLIILPNCNNNDLIFALDRLLSAIRKDATETSKGSINITASIGACVTYPVVGDNPSSFIKLADNTMYDAKRAGRDQYKVAQMIEHSKSA